MNLSAKPRIGKELLTNSVICVDGVVTPPQEKNSK